MTDQNQQSTLLGKIAAYTEILVKDPRSTIFVSLAETYRKMGMFDDARQILSKGLELHSDFSPAHIVLARVLCQLEDFESSEVSFQRALELDNESLAALVGYGRVKILLGEEAEARKLLLRARDLSPADPVINKLLLSLPDELPDNEAVDEEEDPKAPAASLVSSTLAQLYLNQGLREEALNLYRELLAQSPDDLALRRKIKELEAEDSTEESSDIISDSAVDLPDQQEDVVPEALDENTEVTDQPVTTGQEDENTGTTLSGSATDASVLEVLNQWLVSIQQRRGHV
ncbi:MAG: tetratricopeptide repeat protein [Deltaproteobacteria bacterium]|nr:tetratricopeptide repeat protein [Deltaproteobacteria bacterium]